MKKIVKNFENLVNKTLFSTNKLILEVKNKTSIGLKVSNLNKGIISFISLLFFYLFYLSIPNIYDKSWVQNTIENKLIEEYKINFSISSEISYNILPSPHFLIKNSKIFRDAKGSSKSLSEIKKLKVFIGQKNFFTKEKMVIKRVLIDKANFSLIGSDLKLLDKISIRKLSEKKIKLTNSNIFFKNDSNETFAIIKIRKVFLFYDNLKLTNILDLTGDIFNLPFSFILSEQDFPMRTRKININSKKMQLKIFNESVKKSENIITGVNNLSVFNSKISTQYEINKNIVTFAAKNSKIEYSGNLSIKPFDLNLDINLDRSELANIFDVNSIFFEFLKTQLLFNENISANISLNTTFPKMDEVFNSAKINFNLVNGSINFNHSKLINNKIGSMKIMDSRLFLDKDKLILNADIEIDIKNSNNLFSFLQTPKNKRNLIKKVYFNFDYDFLADQVFLNNFRIDENDSNTKMVKIINEFYRDKKQNLNMSRRMLNKLLSYYDG